MLAGTYRAGSRERPIAEAAIPSPRSRTWDQPGRPASQGQRSKGTSPSDVTELGRVNRRCGRARGHRTDPHAQLAEFTHNEGGGVEPEPAAANQLPSG